MIAMHPEVTNYNKKYGINMGRGERGKPICMFTDEDFRIQVQLPQNKRDISIC